VSVKVGGVTGMDDEEEEGEREMEIISSKRSFIRNKTTKTFCFF